MVGDCAISIVFFQDEVAQWGPGRDEAIVRSLTREWSGNEEFLKVPRLFVASMLKPALKRNVFVGNLSGAAGRGFFVLWHALIESA